MKLPRHVHPTTIDTLPPDTQPLHDYGKGRTCPCCGGPLNRYRPSVCNLCEDKGRTAQPTQDFWPGMRAKVLRDAVARVYGSTARAHQCSGVPMHTFNDIGRNLYALSKANAAKLNAGMVHVGEEAAASRDE